MEKFHVWSIFRIGRAYSCFRGFAVTFSQPILTYALAFAAGADDFGGKQFQRRNRIIRISQRWICWGFIVMMVLDVALCRNIMDEDY
jgi:hypothetical protein